MADADHFKALNDTRGHHHGDLALKKLAALCAERVGPKDLVARFGGEEFALLLCDQDLATSARLAEDLRVAVENCGLDFTASFGVAAFAGDLDATLRAADRALYDAKKSGRNRVKVHGGAPPAGGQTGGAPSRCLPQLEALRQGVGRANPTTNPCEEPISTGRPPRRT